MSEENSNIKAKIVNELYTYEQWWINMRIRRVAHIKTVSLYNTMNIILGVTIIVLSALAGSSVFAGIETSQSPFYYIAVAITILLSALTATQTFLALGDKAKAHHQSQANYGALCKMIEDTLRDYIYVNRDKDILEEAMDEAEKRMSELDEKRLYIPQRKYDYARKLVIERLIKETSYQIQLDQNPTVT